MRNAVLFILVLMLIPYSLSYSASISSPATSQIYGGIPVNYSVSSDPDQYVYVDYTDDSADGSVEYQAPTIFSQDIPLQNVSKLGDYFKMCIYSYANHEENGFPVLQPFIGVYGLDSKSVVTSTSYTWNCMYAPTAYLKEHGDGTYRIGVSCINCANDYLYTYLDVGYDNSSSGHSYYYNDTWHSQSNDYIMNYTFYYPGHDTIMYYVDPNSHEHIIKTISKDTSDSDTITINNTQLGNYTFYLSHSDDEYSSTTKSVDTVAPVISNYNVTKSSISQYSYNCIYANVSDNGTGVKSVTAYVTYPDGTNHTVALYDDGSCVGMNNDYGDNIYSNTIYAGEYIGNFNVYKIDAVDGSGNTASSTGTASFASTRAYTYTTFNYSYLSHTSKYSTPDTYGSVKITAHTCNYYPTTRDVAVDIPIPVSLESTDILDSSSQYNITYYGDNRYATMVVSVPSSSCVDNYITLDDYYYAYILNLKSRTDILSSVAGYWYNYLNATGINMISYDAQYMYNLYESINTTKSYIDDIYNNMNTSAFNLTSGYYEIYDRNYDQRLSNYWVDMENIIQNYVNNYTMYMVIDADNDHTYILDNLTDIKNLEEYINSTTSDTNIHVYSIQDYLSGTIKPELDGIPIYYNSIIDYINQKGDEMLQEMYKYSKIDTSLLMCAKSLPWLEGNSQVSMAKYYPALTDYVYSATSSSYEGGYKSIDKSKYITPTLLVPREANISNLTLVLNSTKPEIVHRHLLNRFYEGSSVAGGDYIYVIPNTRDYELYMYNRNLDLVQSYISSSLGNGNRVSGMLLLHDDSGNPTYLVDITQTRRVYVYDPLNISKGPICILNRTTSSMWAYGIVLSSNSFIIADGKIVHEYSAETCSETFSYDLNDYLEDDISSYGVADDNYSPKYMFFADDRGNIVRIHYDYSDKSLLNLTQALGENVSVPLIFSYYNDSLYAVLSDLNSKQYYIMSIDPDTMTLNWVNRGFNHSIGPLSIDKYKDYGLVISYGKLYTLNLDNGDITPSVDIRGHSDGIIYVTDKYSPDSSISGDYYYLVFGFNGKFTAYKASDMSVFLQSSSGKIPITAMYPTITYTKHGNNYYIAIITSSISSGKEGVDILEYPVVDIPEALYSSLPNVWQQPGGSNLKNGILDHYYRVSTTFTEPHYVHIDVGNDGTYEYNISNFEWGHEYVINDQRIIDAINSELEGTYMEVVPVTIALVGETDIPYVGYIKLNSYSGILDYKLYNDSIMNITLGDYISKPVSGICNKTNQLLYDTNDTFILNETIQNNTVSKSLSINYLISNISYVNTINGNVPIDLCYIIHSSSNVLADYCTTIIASNSTTTSHNVTIPISLSNGTYTIFREAYLGSAYSPTEVSFKNLGDINVVLPVPQNYNVPYVVNVTGVPTNITSNYSSKVISYYLQLIPGMKVPVKVRMYIPLNITSDDITNVVIFGDNNLTYTIGKVEPKGNYSFLYATFYVSGGDINTKIRVYARSHKFDYDLVFIKRSIDANLVKDTVANKNFAPTVVALGLLGLLLKRIIL